MPSIRRFAILPRSIAKPGRERSPLHPFQNHRRRRQPLFRAPPEQISALIATLDGSRFKDRQEASETLALQVELAEPAYRRALTKPLSPETRRRLERILGATLVALGIDLAAASRYTFSETAGQYVPAEVTVVGSRSGQSIRVTL